MCLSFCYSCYTCYYCVKWRNVRETSNHRISYLLSWWYCFNWIYNLVGVKLQPVNIIGWGLIANANLTIYLSMNILLGWVNNFALFSFLKFLLFPKVARLRPFNQTCPGLCQVKNNCYLQYIFCKYIPHFYFFFSSFAISSMLSER